MSLKVFVENLFSFEKRLTQTGGIVYVSICFNKKQDECTNHRQNQYSGSTGLSGHDV